MMIYHSVDQLVNGDDQKHCPVYSISGARWIVDIDIAERVILAATVSGEGESMPASGDYIKHIRRMHRFVCDLY